MSYRISYEGGKRCKAPCGKPKRWGKWTAAGVFAVLLIWLAAGTWGEQLFLFLLPGDPEITARAIRTMVTGLQAGESVREVFSSFCMEIMAHGQV